MPNTNPSASPLANSCKWCGGALPAGADLHGACRSDYLASPMHARAIDRAADACNENAAWDRAEASFDGSDLPDDSGPHDSYPYDGSIGIGGAL